MQLKTGDVMALGMFLMQLIEDAQIMIPCKCDKEFVKLCIIEALKDKYYDTELDMYEDDILQIIDENFGYIEEVLKSKYNTAPIIMKAFEQARQVFAKVVSDKPIEPISQSPPKNIDFFEALKQSYK